MLGRHLGEGLQQVERRIMEMGIQKSDQLGTSCFLRLADEHYADGVHRRLPHKIEHRVGESVAPVGIHACTPDNLICRRPLQSSLRPWLAAVFAAVLPAVLPAGCGDAGSPGEAAPPAGYCANRSSGVVHRADCRHVDRIKPDHRRWSDHLPDLIAEGYRPCSYCLRRARGRGGEANSPGAADPPAADLAGEILRARLTWASPYGPMPTSLPERFAELDAWASARGLRLRAPDVESAYAERLESGRHRLTWSIHADGDEARVWVLVFWRDARGVWAADSTQTARFLAGDFGG